MTKALMRWIVELPHRPQRVERFLLDSIVMRQGLAALVLVAALGSCAAGIARPASEDNNLDALWIEPRDLASRDLFYGPGGPSLVPRADAQYELEKRDTAGFSITYDVRDQTGQEWSVKIGPEAQTEVASARIVWSMGYHQPPTYYVKKWTYKNSDTAAVHGRFRPKLAWLKSTGIWDWKKNPFVGTEPLRGLKVLMMILNNTDLKPLQNAVYAVDGRGPGQWFVVKDLGATLGETGVVNPRRGWIDGFEKHGFIDKVDGDRVRFEYHGLRGDIFEDVTVQDVRWMCERLGRLTDKQWKDALRAGGYEDPVAARYIARIQEKIRIGKGLPDTLQ
jgi:hypothetical protein